MPQTRDEISAKLAEIVSDTRGIDEDDCVDDATLFEDLTLESIDFLQLSFMLEEEWGVPLPSDDLGEVFGLVGSSTSTRDDVARGLSLLKKILFIEAPKGLKGLDPLDQATLLQSVRDLITFGTLVTFVEKHAA